MRSDETVVTRARRIGALTVIFAGLALGAAACGGAPEPTDDQAAVDREMDLALGDEPAEPELRDEPQEEARPAPTPAPPPAPPAARPRPQPAPPPPAPPAAEAEVVEAEPEPDPEPRMIDLTARTGAEFRVELRQELSTKTNQPGDGFTTTVIDPLVDGSRVVVQSGSIVRGEVTAVQKSGGAGQPAIIKVQFNDLTMNGETYPLRATVVEATPETEGRYSTGDKAARIGVGAVAGGILGRVIGGNAKGTLIGAAVGAAAGTAITLATDDVDAILPAGSTMRLRLDEPLTVTIPDPYDG